MNHPDDSPLEIQAIRLRPASYLKGALFVHSQISSSLLLITTTSLIRLALCFVLRLWLSSQLSLSSFHFRSISLASLSLLSSGPSTTMASVDFCSGSTASGSLRGRGGGGGRRGGGGRGGGRGDGGRGHYRERVSFPLRLRT